MIKGTPSLKIYEDIIYLYACTIQHFLSLIAYFFILLGITLLLSSFFKKMLKNISAFVFQYAARDIWTVVKRHFKEIT